MSRLRRKVRRGGLQRRVGPSQGLQPPANGRQRLGASSPPPSGVGASEGRSDASGDGAALRSAAQTLDDALAEMVGHLEDAAALLVLDDGDARAVELIDEAVSALAACRRDAVACLRDAANVLEAG